MFYPEVKIIRHTKQKEKKKQTIAKRYEIHK